MPSTEPLDIKVIYSASGARAKPARRAAPKAERGESVTARRKTASLGGAARAARPFREVLVLAGLNLTVGMTMLAVTWWPVDRFIYQKFVYKTPLDLAQLGPMLGLSPQQIAEHAAGDPSQPAPAEPRITGTAAQAVIGASGYGWLTLSTAAGYALALAAGAALGGLGSPALRRVAWILFLGALSGLIVTGVMALRKYGLGFPPSTLRWGMVLAGVAAALLGMGLARGARRWSQAAAALVVVAALGSVAGLYLGGLCGAIAPEQSGAMFLLMVFVVHSAYGWALWLAAPRVMGASSE